jgi:hypothetical protein
LIAGFDPGKDTPVEMLHTILLGIIRYAWLMTTAELQKKGNLKSLPDFLADLGSINVEGLDIPKLRPTTMVRYAASLVGRQYKEVVQTVPFHVHKYVGVMHGALWRAIGPLCALLWYPVIKDMETYLVRIRL